MTSLMDNSWNRWWWSRRCRRRTRRTRFARLTEFLTRSDHFLRRQIQKSRPFYNWKTLLWMLQNGLAFWNYNWFVWLQERTGRIAVSEMRHILSNLPEKLSHKEIDEMLRTADKVIKVGLPHNIYAQVFNIIVL